MISREYLIYPATAMLTVTKIGVLKIVTILAWISNPSEHLSEPHPTPRAG
jgi:hypothetical protein